MDPLKLVEDCYQKLPKAISQKPWELTNRGRKILKTENELNAYMAAYGEMHIIKCRVALQNFPFDDLDLYPYEIFDWGCGQGLATLTLLEMLRERKKLSKLQKIYLIEPSKPALDRAKAWVLENIDKHVDVIAINKYIPHDEKEIMPEVVCSSRISVNLFSNILDIETLNLKWLANKTASLAKENYMICVGPKYGEGKNTRITDFCAYFDPKNYFSNIDIPRYRYTSRTHHLYGCQSRCFKHSSTSTINYNYQERADSINSLDPYDYASECYQSVIEDETIKFYNELRENLPDTYDILLQPAINCDRVDLIVKSKEKGIILINTCEDLSLLDKKLDSLNGVKSNLFDFHLRNLKMDSIIKRSIYGYIKTALFFPHHTDEEINETISELIEEKVQNSQKRKYTFLLKFTTNTDLRKTFEDITAVGFKEDYYQELINLILPKWHSYKDGDINFNLSSKQKELVKYSDSRLRVKGVAGSGKTLVAAYRAVEQHLRTGEKVLIITFNITLIQYFKMRIQQVPADFSMNMFEINNYHQFIKSMANRYIGNITITDYNDPKFFTKYKKDIEKYKTIIIDEVQDFKYEWLLSIINNFLAEDGTISVFGDGEQNIYRRVMDKETKMPQIPTFVNRPWRELNERVYESIHDRKKNERITRRILNSEIAKLAYKFERQFIDASIPPLEAVEESFLDNYNVKYGIVKSDISADKLAKYIRQIIKTYEIPIEEVTVLGQSINLLRDIDDSYKKLTKQNTMINFETKDEYNSVLNAYADGAFQVFVLDGLRRTAKTHFTTMFDGLKMSTIHSFKGWESNTIILFLQPTMENDSSYNNYRITAYENVNALIYTALTRARYNLFIINLGNTIYHSFFNEALKEQ